MCGITGLFEPNDAQASRATVAQMTDALVHRGPDATGIWAEGAIALGHRRLSILDLSDAGAQPMHSACGRYVLAYNGEIYNHLELRIALKAAGAAPDWRGHSVAARSLWRTFCGFLADPDTSCLRCHPRACDRWVV
jgi:asparagine synthase (glutamine-hydrolysing)